MAFFHREGWKSFWPNFLAVILGIGITFSGERVISDYIERQNAREIFVLFKTDVRHHLKASEQILSDMGRSMSCVQQAAKTYKEKHSLDEVPLDTLRTALRAFFSVSGDVYTSIGMPMLENSGTLRTVDDEQVVESVSRIASTINAYWKQYDIMLASIAAAKQHLYESGHVVWKQDAQMTRENCEYRFRCLMEDRLCSGLISRGTILTYLNMFAKMNEDIRKEMADIEQAGY